MDYAAEWVSRKIFVASFGLSTFFEVIFGTPSFLFVIVPFLVTSVFDGDSGLLMSCAFLATICIFAFGGLVTFVLNLVGRNKYIRTQQAPNDEWYKIKTYDNFNCVVIVLLGISSALHGFSKYDVFEPVGKAIYIAQLNGYHEFNPSCPSTNQETKTSTEIFVDDLQEKYDCCGWDNVTDWLGRVDIQDKQRLPYSCCPRSTSCRRKDVCRMTDKKHFVKSCKTPVLLAFRKFDPSSYNVGVLYFVSKALAYLTYCNSYKHIIEADSPLLSRTV